eukprot:gnl/TRDRNA2_/TRDRNA2_161297_c1_seq2.p1 gnl/TRDRNA2_/TRDRNA2_161297_c1~~gnl/TRDRNA2_/TRDRNA2_161297_c1_seq2.p1  ORF type:complete len:239 (-),score=43.33 gnl/TRDRNA2_/TRDRNA2_161297_c1_seq2:197-913(-)
MSLTQLLSLGRPPPKPVAALPERPWPVGAGSADELSMAPEEVELAREFEQERQQEWAERRIINRALAEAAEHQAKTVASELAEVVVFDEEVLAKSRRRKLRRLRRQQRGDRSMSESSRSSSHDAPEGTALANRSRSSSSSPSSASSEVREEGAAAPQDTCSGAGRNSKDASRRSRSPSGKRARPGNRRCASQAAMVKSMSNTFSPLQLAGATSACALLEIKWQALEKSSIAGEAPEID